MADDDVRWEGEWMDATADFAKLCAHVRESNPHEQPALEAVMIFLATEFFDRFFSVTEIRSAFTTALDCLPQYAAGEERRGDKF